MPFLEAVGTAVPANVYTQKDIMPLVRKIFADAFKDIDRLMKVFGTGLVHERHFAMPLDWYTVEHSFSEKNRCFQQAAYDCSIRAVEDCLEQLPASSRQVDAVFVVTSTGIMTPGLDVALIEALDLPATTERYPLWGYGCAGGVSGLNKAFTYCERYPERKALLVCVEMCSTTFQHDDTSKSNLVGTSLFADGAAAVVVSGDQAGKSDGNTLYYISGFQSLLPHSQEIMGWEIKEGGLHVIFAPKIPELVHSWAVPETKAFLTANGTELEDIVSFVSHPGGRKVLEAYEEGLSVPKQAFAIAYDVLARFGNMSSPTVLFVLKERMKYPRKHGEKGLMSALGPGFSTDLLLFEWKGA
ncbi:type III polyketide synthase [Bacillaceae bacterium SIJ1]|uniref:type III polyketide synthase n=1 Tax=Litoribacterium kuwaitense TaxID=1398745 RepID=UPI0013EDF15E|nr:3-oxoacyl-[acyl-carrier-protein] synthase III C-terminal domain-containing protein [Litoribacterium kuwaitense]NGP43762.1 type III polyketide synthase [Litoribacterium kuwaitense]